MNLLDNESVALQQGFLGLAGLELEKIIPEGICFKTQAGPLSVTFYAPGIIRFHLKQASLPDYGLLVNPPQPVPVQVTASENHYRLESGGVTLEVFDYPVRLRISRGKKVLLESVTDRTIQGDLRFMPFGVKAEEWLVSLALNSGEPVFGLGEKFGPLNRRGQLITCWNRDALGVNAEASYKNSPFAWSPEGWGLFVHTPARVEHGVGYPQWSHRSYIMKVQDPNLDLFLFVGETGAEILHNYTHLTGRAPRLPTWSFGVWMARAYYKTRQEILEVAYKLREHRIPSEVLLLDGRAWHPMETRFDFSWDPERYPDPPGFVNELKGIHYRLCLWEYPYISTRNPLFNELAEKGYLLLTPDGQPYVHKWLPEPLEYSIPHLQPSGIIDFTNPAAYQWYRDMHHKLHDIGVAAMKPDYGEAVPQEVVASNGDNGVRLHNIYALLYNRCVYEASKMYGDGEGFVWSRAGWTGSQNIPIQWGGDPQVDWEGLAGNIRGGLSWGMSGVPFYAHDIGGFAIGQPSPELYVRWAQAGVMASHTRFHGIGLREPWEFGEQAEKIVRQWLEWRYRLIPYLQACAQIASETGLPVMRAMPLAFPDHPPAWCFNEQYLLGPALLVIPVLRPDGWVRFYLPPGAWYDIWTGERLEGPQMMEVSVPLDRIPVFGREGYVLPLGPVVQHTGEIPPEKPIHEIWAFGKLSEPLPGLDMTTLPSRPDQLTRHAIA